MVTANGGRLDEVVEDTPLKQVGRYDLLEVIGRGGAAVVYLARQSDLQRYVALKELAPFHADDESFAQRFVEEGRLAGSMNHANIVTVHEFFEIAGAPYIAMEYLPHGSLRQYIESLSLAQIAGVLEGVLAGLSHGGAQGVVHRDLKPENLLVAVDGRVKIADFGVARAFNNARTRAVVTVTGTTIGTPAYMSPEQALGDDLGPACDLYSLGVIAWEMFAGHTPFAQSDTPVAVLYRHVHEQIAPVRSVAPHVDERIDRWVSRMLAKDPADRYPSADDAWYALEDIVLDLLGPRWRRDARLAIDDTPTVDRAPLTPARFTDSDLATPDPIDTPGDRPAVAGHDAADPASVHEPGLKSARRRDTQPPMPVIPETVGGMQTVAPRSRPRPSYTTILRPARRHRDPGPEAAGEPRAPWRRRSAVLGILAAMAGAAVLGVVLAAPEGPHGPSAAAQRSAQRAVATTQARALSAERAAVVSAADDRIISIMNALGPRRSRAVTRLDNSTTPSTEIAAARGVQRDYAQAARQVAAHVHQTSKAQPLVRTLRGVAADYGRLATAVSKQDSAMFTAAKRSITSGERGLQRRIDAL